MTKEEFLQLDMYDPIVILTLKEEVRALLEAGVISIEELSEDPRWEIRCVAVRVGGDLSVLVNDPVAGVRTTVANVGYGHDILVNDPNEMVRAMVAWKGSYFEKLKDDPRRYVRLMAHQGHRKLQGTFNKMYTSDMQDN